MHSKEMPKLCRGQFCILTNNIQSISDKAYLRIINLLSTPVKKYYSYLNYFLAYIFSKKIILSIDNSVNNYTPDYPYLQTCKDCNYNNYITELEFNNIFLSTPKCPQCNGFNIIISTLSSEIGDYTHLTDISRSYAPLLMTNIQKYNDYYNYIMYYWEFQDFQSISDDELLNEWIVVDF